MVIKMISRETEQLLELVSREKQKYTKRENLIFDSEELSQAIQRRTTKPQNMFFTFYLSWP